MSGLDDTATRGGTAAEEVDTAAGQPDAEPETVATYAGSGRKGLGLLRMRGEAIVLHAMRRPDEIRDPSELAPAATKPADNEISQAEHLIDRMTRDDLESPDFTNHRTDAVAKLVEARLDGRELPKTPEPATSPRTTDHAGHGPNGPEATP
ncbi:hypothetical protein OG226_01155 [Streptomyces sp. NBC_01261]|uniref:hypothetical protein n=1 Tax=Streptomyces sp. NBC_01261 TaxID=2903802 RepID=UPI002E35E99D|nr:hypothetical protein [Streptomyces sp. NBC_01261]